MNIEIATTPDAGAADRAVLTFHSGRRLIANGDKSDCQVALSTGVAYFFGDLYYIRDAGHCRPVSAASPGALADWIRGKQPQEIQAGLEGQYLCLLVDRRDHCAHVFADRFARRPCFVLEEGEEVVISNELDPLFLRQAPQYDQLMLAHLLSTYGWFTPQGKTIYSNVRELRIGEILTITSDAVSSTQVPFTPRNIEDYEEHRLDEYYSLLRQAILCRSNPAGTTWVSASGGWDTSMILSVLASEFEARNIAMITARIRSFGEAGQVFNLYEIEKVQRLARHFGLRSEIIDLRFDESEEEYWLAASRYCRGRHNYAFCSTYFQPVSDWLLREAGPGRVVLNGETSDSFHNFGFSQYKTLFHTSSAFCEYADKMNCYLFGPTFFRKVLEGKHDCDRVFSLLVGAAQCNIRNAWSSSAERTQRYLYPFFYGSAHNLPRLPFVEGSRNPLLTEKCAAELASFPFGVYAPWVAEVMSPENIYSVLTHLYHHFHCQGATVAAHKHSMERHGHRLRLPFYDSCLVDFLASAPESWGRGLEINLAKYPLKETARRRPELNFPYAQLAQGPHDYLSDTVPGYSLYDDVVHRSGLRSLFLRQLRESPFEELLSDDYFDLKYLRRLISQYEERDSCTRAELANLVALIALSMVGWH
jgi:asparagine synthetase B (glutamine-hydrolysing)